MFGLTVASALFSSLAQADDVDAYDNPAWAWYSTFNTPTTFVAGVLSGQARCNASPIPNGYGYKGITCSTVPPGDNILFIYGTTSKDAWWAPNGIGNNSPNGSGWGFGNFYSYVGVSCSNNEDY
jgi:hypothetical protein